MIQAWRADAINMPSCQLTLRSVAAGYYRWSLWIAVHMVLHSKVRRIVIAVSRFAFISRNYVCVFVLHRYTFMVAYARAEQRKGEAYLYISLFTFPIYGEIFIKLLYRKMIFVLTSVISCWICAFSIIYDSDHKNKIIRAHRNCLNKPWSHHASISSDIYIYSMNSVHSTEVRNSK